MGRIEAQFNRRAGTTISLALFLILTGIMLTSCAAFKDWKYLPATKAEERTIHVVNHGWHTGLILARQDLGNELAFLDAYLHPSPYYEFGWGEADFYQAEEVTTRLVLKALFWRNATVLHAAAVPVEPARYFANSEVVELNLSETGLEQLRKTLRSSFQFDAQGRPYPLKHGQYGESRFFKAEGYYFITKTCNSWTATLLESAGMPMDSVLMLRSGSVISQVRAAKERYACCAN